LEERRKGEAHANCEPRRAEGKAHRGGRKVDISGGSVSRWRGGEVTGAGTYRLSGGARRQQRVERLEKKMERKGGEVGGQ
jgi:hypothetical protein